MPVLSQIHVFPVKSLAGFSAPEWPLEKNGLRYDRQWMLVDAAGQFLSQRRLPAMALIKTRIENESLLISAAGQADLRVALRSSGGEDAPVQIWKDQCAAKRVDAAADAWFSRVLGFACRLVYMPDETVRGVDPNYAGPGDRTAFSDGFPLLLVSEASLRALNAAMSLNMDMIRFRPNLVVADCASYAEDAWRRIRINGIGFRLPKPCSRCSIPTIDPETAVSGKEPLTTLARLRQWQNKVYFGQNVLHDGLGQLKVGSVVDIVETGPMQPPL
ncbi:MAG: MOSC N-terminal beta barrel domain-containing protein [Methylomonas sp.]|jgi:uncharacterized protein YcbX